MSVIKRQFMVAAMGVLITLPTAATMQSGVVARRSAS